MCSLYVCLFDVQLSITLNINPFLPSGVIVYALSISSMKWSSFLIGQAARIPCVAIMAYAGYNIRHYEANEPLENTNIDLISIDNAYQSNEYTFAFTVLFCVLFGILFLFTICRMGFQYKKLVLGMYGSIEWIDGMKWIESVAFIAFIAFISMMCSLGISLRICGFNPLRFSFHLISRHFIH